MADDPNRDILPVKEGSYADTIFSTIDPRERHLVCKLDRYQLEDKYLRLLDEANNLKKLSNSQEDKIKRLGTKLIRLAGNPRSCGLALDIADDRNRTSTLELENTKLKEKIAALRNQLLSHTMSGRSSSRSRNLTRPTSSGLVTCRSENNRARVPSCQCIIESKHDDSDMQNYLVKIEKLEAQKKDMAYRIADLEKELTLYTTSSSQREKVAENVEYIRVWRQMKQLNDKLITAQEKNVVLTTEINDLKTTLEQTTRNNQEIVAVLTSERTRMAEIDDQMLKAKNSQLTLREKDEQIRDLMSEMKILQQHNNELITLTSKYGQVELENIELKKKLSEHAHEQQSLKTAFNNEQVNIVALQATNEQLLAKLLELQTNIDTLTVQLASFHKQNEKRDITMENPSPTDVAREKENTSNFKRSTISIEQCNKCCEMYDKVTQLEKIVGNSREDWPPTDKSVQTITVVANTKEQSTMTLPENKEEVGSRLQSSLKEWKTNQERRMETNGTSVLSREEILKLLDQAQINAPLDASRIAQKGGYASILDATQRHSDGSSRTPKDDSNDIQKNSIYRRKFKSLENPNMTAGRILLILFDILQEYLLLNNADEGASASRQVSTNGNPLIDVNNNNLTMSTADDIKENNVSIETRDSGDENYVTMTISDNNRITSADAYNHKDDCTCDHVKTCRANAESNCCTNCVPQSIAVCTNDSTSPACEEEYASVSMNDIGSSKRTIDTTCFSRIYEKYRESPYRDISNDHCAEKITKKPKMPSRYPKCDLMCRLQKVKDLLSEQEEQKLPCKIKCLKDSLELPLCATESFPLLITDRQGLVEIHVLRLQLSTSAAKIPEEEDICNLHAYISWDIWDEKTAYTPRMKCPNLNFDSSSVYRITDLFSFFKNVLSEYLVFRVNIVRQNGTSYMLARAKVSIKDILDYPQNKLHYVVPVSCVISCLCGINLGQLSLWIRLSCNVDMVETFKKQCGISSLPDTFHVPGVQKNGNDVPPRAVGPPSFDVVAFKNRNSTDSPVSEVSNNQHGQSSIDSNFQHETEDSNDDYHYISSNNHGLPSPINENKTEGENSRIIARKCPDSEVSTDDRKGSKQNDALTKSSSAVRFKALLSNQLTKDTIIIEIVSILLFDEGSIMQDDEIRLLFVEYSFLGHYGEDMETVSVKKPQTSNQEMVYNFKRTFRIDEKTHSAERDSLRAMLKESTSPNIKFFIVSEPLPEENEIKDCQDIGYATFNIKEYALGDGGEDVSLPIKEIHRDKQIGILKIIVLGFDTIRQCLMDTKTHQ